LVLKILDTVPNSSLLDELSGGINVEEKAIIKALDLAGVSRPHVESICRNIFLVTCIEEFGKATNLLVILLVKAVFDNLTQEVHHILKMCFWAEVLSLLI